MFPSLFTYLIVSIFPGFGIGAVLFFTLGGGGGSSNGSAASFMGYAFTSILISYAFIIFLRAWYIKTYIKRYYYDCNDQFVTIKKGVFAPTEIHVQYQKIQDVYVDQDFIDRLMGLYDVHIASATVTSGIEAHIDGVEQSVAEAIKNFMLAKIQGGNVSASSANPQAPQPPQAPRPAITFQSSQKISSATYPISGAWVFSAIVGAFFYSFLLTLILGSWFVRIVASLFSSSSIDSLNSGSVVGYVVLLFLIVFFGRIIWVLIWKSQYYFEFLPDYILLRTGVISRSENHLPYKAIQNVTNRQGVIERMLGIATVSIENAAFVGVAQKSFSLSGGRSMARSAGIALIGQPVEKAESLNQLLNQIVSSQTNSSAMGV